jgi:adenylate cyclase
MTYKILVVDDERLIQTLFNLRFKTEIQQNLYEFIFALNGLEALQKLEENPDVNLILTDLNMPQMDGLTFMEQLKEKEIVIPTIVVSAYSDPQNYQKAKNLGALDFIVKPINFQALDSIIRKNLISVAD